MYVFADYKHGFFVQQTYYKTVNQKRFYASCLPQNSEDQRLETGSLLHVFTSSDMRAGRVVGQNSSFSQIGRKFRWRNNLLSSMTYGPEIERVHRLYIVLSRQVVNTHLSLQWIHLHPLRRLGLRTHTLSSSNTPLQFRGKLSNHIFPVLHPSVQDVSGHLQLENRI